jgi:DNA mismatch repair protein MutL
MLAEINLLGFDIEEFGANTFKVNGVPAEMGGKIDEVKVIESLLEQYKSNVELKLGARENIARSMARSTAIKRGQALDQAEMQSLIDKLFACQVPFKSPSGRSCFITYDFDELEKRFNA